MANTLLEARGAEDAGFVVRAAAQSGDACSTVTAKQAAKLLKSGDRMVWIDVLVDEPAKAAQFLQHDLGFHRLYVEDALSELERPTLHEGESYLFFTVPAIT